MTQIKNIPRIFLLLLIITNLESADKIAVTTKVFGKVNIERIGDSGLYDLKPGTVLSDGDRIVTGKGGFVAIIYIDDKSMVKIKENTEIIIRGTRKTGSIAKQVNIDNGTIRAQVNKQRKGDFIVQSATSVASVKGTDFWFITDPATGDLLIGLDGSVSLTNLLSGESINVGSGTTGISTLEGEINTADTNPDNIPNDPYDTNGGQGSQIEIELEGSDGKIKTLRIDIQ